MTLLRCQSAVRFFWPKCSVRFITLEYTTNICNSSCVSHTMCSSLQGDHHHVTAAVIQKWPLGRSSHTRLCAVEADLGQLNTGLASAWRKAASREDCQRRWRQVASVFSAMTPLVGWQKGIRPVENSHQQSMKALLWETYKGPSLTRRELL